MKIEAVFALGNTSTQVEQRRIRLRWAKPRAHGRHDHLALGRRGCGDAAHFRARQRRDRTLLRSRFPANCRPLTATDPRPLTTPTPAGGPHGRDTHDSVLLKKTHGPIGVDHRHPQREADSVQRRPDETRRRGGAGKSISARKRPTRRATRSLPKRWCRPPRTQVPRHRRGLVPGRRRRCSCKTCGCPRRLPEEWDKLVRQEAASRLPFPCRRPKSASFPGSTSPGRQRQTRGRAAGLSPAGSRAVSRDRARRRAAARGRGRRAGGHRSAAFSSNCARRRLEPAGDVRAHRRQQRAGHGRQRAPKCSS